MKKIILLISILLASVSTATAGDSVSAGIRAGAATNHSSYVTEVFGDLYLNNLISVGATVAYQVLDRDASKTAKRDESLPITALAKFHAPLPILKPYAGLGEAVIFHDKTSATGSPVILAGIDFKPLPMPLFLNLEYRHQFNGNLDILAGGIGVKF